VQTSVSANSSYAAPAALIDLPAFLLDIETEWTLNALLMTSSSYRKCSKRRTLDR